MPSETLCNYIYFRASFLLTIFYIFAFVANVKKRHFFFYAPINFQEQIKDCPLKKSCFYFSLFMFFFVFPFSFFVVYWIFKCCLFLFKQRFYAKIWVSLQIRTCVWVCLCLWKTYSCFASVSLQVCVSICAIVSCLYLWDFLLLVCVNLFFILLSFVVPVLQSKSGQLFLYKSCYRTRHKEKHKTKEMQKKNNIKRKKNLLLLFSSLGNFIFSNTKNYAR